MTDGIILCFALERIVRKTSESCLTSSKASRKKAKNANENRCFQRPFSSPSASRQPPSQILTLKVVKRVVGAYTPRPRLTPLYRCDKLRQEEQAVARAACFLATDRGQRLEAGG